MEADIDTRRLSTRSIVALSGLGAIMSIGIVYMIGYGSTKIDLAELLAGLSGSGTGSCKPDLNPEDLQLRPRTVSLAEWKEWIRNANKVTSEICDLEDDLDKARNVDEELQIKYKLHDKQLSLRYYEQLLGKSSPFGPH